MIPWDKISHFTAGVTVGSIVGTFVNPWWACPAGLAAGLLKELIDWKVRGTGFDWRDMACTFLGGCFVFWLHIVEIVVKL